MDTVNFIINFNVYILPILALLSLQFYESYT
jgi:hypothetical protein